MTEQARLDDLKSLAYVLMYFLCGKFPLQGFKAVTKQRKCDRITEKRITTPTDCLYRGSPNKLRISLSYYCTLCFDDKPDYSYLHKLFCGLFIDKEIPVRLCL